MPCLKNFTTTYPDLGHACPLAALPRTACSLLHTPPGHTHSPEVQACKHRNFHKEASDQQVARREEGFCKAKCLNFSWGSGLEEGLKFRVCHLRTLASGSRTSEGVKK